MGELREERMRAHLLSAPAPDPVAAARRLTATQAQEFWGGRWALAVRAEGEPTLAEVDAAFDRGDLVRSWTQRGTLHIIAAADLAWMLEVTRERQQRQHAGVDRALGIDADVLDRAERAVRPALAGGGRLTRGEFAEVLTGAGIDVAGMRGNHILSALALRAAVVLGPVLPRAGAPARDQYLIAPDEWITDAASPPDPLAELFVCYLAGHGPASVADFRWWTGLTLGAARAARDGAGDRVVEVAEGLFAVAAALAGPARASARDARDARDAHEVLALPPFDEYYLAYADRGVAGPPDTLAAVGPTVNGLVRAVLLSRGEVVGTWRHSFAVGRHHLAPIAEPFPGAVAPASVDAALDRFARFVRG